MLKIDRSDEFDLSTLDSTTSTTTTTSNPNHIDTNNNSRLFIYDSIFDPQPAPTTTTTSQTPTIIPTRTTTTTKTTSTTSKPTTQSSQTSAYSILSQEINGSLESPRRRQLIDNKKNKNRYSRDISSSPKCSKLSASASGFEHDHAARLLFSSHTNHDGINNFNESSSPESSNSGTNQNSGSIGNSSSGSSSQLSRVSASREIATCQFCGRAMLKKNIPTHIRRAHTPKEELICLNEEQNIFTIQHLKPGQRRKRSTRAYDYSQMISTVNIDEVDPCEGIENKFITEGEEITSADLVQLADRIRYGMSQVSNDTLGKLVDVLGKIETNTEGMRIF